MYRAILCALMGAAAFAQSSTPPAEKPPAVQAPPEVDQALRTRINEFYTMMKSQQYRKAEAWVAEDTKDYYYAGTKPSIKAFELEGIQYSDDFTRATATVKCTEPVVLAGFPPHEVTLSIRTHWKIEDGLWMAYEDLEKIKNPTGLETRVKTAVEQASQALAGPPDMPKEMPTDPSYIMGKIELDKKEVTLERGKPETISIHNKANGVFSLMPGYPLKGIDAKVDPLDVGAGQTATLTLTAGKDAANGVYAMRVQPTGEILEVRITIKK